MSDETSDVRDALPGETVEAAVERLRQQYGGTFRLRHNDVVLPIDPSVDPIEAGRRFGHERERRARAQRSATLPLLGGPYDGRVRVGATCPDVILVGINRERYEAVRDPDGGERLGFVWVSPDHVRGDDGPCQDCGKRYPPWSAPNEVWNVVVGGPEADDDPGGMLCPTCFVIRAERAGEQHIWRLVPRVPG